MAGIACVGILCVDALGKPVDSLPEKGKLKLVDDITLQIGGCAANVSIALSKLGLRPSVIGRIGKDRLGGILMDTLKQEQVDTAGLTLDDQVSTSASLVMISNDSERSIVHAMGANRYFCYDDINLDIIRNSSILLVAGSFLMPSFDGPGTEKLLQYASTHGVLCCLDTAWDATGQWMQKLGPSLPYLDWFMPSFEEACKLSNESDLGQIAASFFSRGVKNVVVKLDKMGCYVHPRGEPGYIVPSYGNIRVKDSSGAGDSFCAGFLAGLYQGWDVRKCARFANAVGAHCVMEIGTTTGIRPMQEILSFMDNYKSGNISVL